MQPDSGQKAYARLRVRVEDANVQHPGDSPQGPAVPLQQPAGNVPYVPVRTAQEDAAAKQRSISAAQPPVHDAHKTMEQPPLRKRGLRSHASAGEGGGLMSVVPLDVGRLQAKLINIRLKAAEMANQLLEAQWASPGSKGTTHSAPSSQIDTPTQPSQRPESLPLVPLARKPTHSGPGVLGSMSFSTQHQPHSRPFFPDNQPSILDRQRTSSHHTPLHHSRHYHESLTASSSNAPLQPSPPQSQRHKSNSRPVSRSNSKTWSRATSLSRSSSQAASRRASKNGSEAACSKRGSREGEQDVDVVELPPAPPSPPSLPAIEPEVIKSTSKRLVELVKQRQKEGVEAAAAAKAAAAEAREASLTAADAQVWDVQEGNVWSYSRLPKSSTSELQGKALAERALATIDKAFSLLLKVQEGSHARAQEGRKKELSSDAVSVDQSDSLQQCAHQLRSLQQDITERSSFHRDSTERSSSQRDTSERSSLHRDAMKRSSEAGSHFRGSQLSLPQLVSRAPDFQRDPFSSSDADRTSAPTFQCHAKRHARTESGIKRASEPMGHDEQLSLVEAARQRSLTANTNYNQRASQFKQPSGMELEGGLRRGLRTAKMILRELKDRHQEDGEDGQSSVSSVSDGSNEEEEMTEQEQVYGRGIWGVVGNPAEGKSVAIPVVPPTPDGQRYSGAFGRVGKQRQRLLEEQRTLLSRNPAAYEEDLARQSEDNIRKLAEEAHLQLERSGGPISDSRTIREFMKSIKMLQSQRPFYLPPIQAKERVQRKPVEAKAEQLQQLVQVSKSLFEERRQMSETHEMIDTDKVKQNQFDLDFSRVAAKPLFCKLLNRIDENMRRSSGSLRLDQYIGMLHKQMSAYRDQLRSIFIFYSCVASRFASEEFGRVTLSSWLQFCSDAHIMDNAQKGCTRADLATVFVAVKGGTDSKANDAISDDAMMRFEFYEGIARAAYAKYILPRHLDELSDAVVMTIEACVLPNVPREALLDPNTFRNERLQSPAMEQFLADHWSFLTALYKLFKARDRTRYFRVEHWGTLLEASKLNAHQAGLDKRDAKLIFSWSQLSVLDELKKRKRTVALTQWDFIEAVCRLAEHQALPSEAELDSYFVNEQGMDPKRVVQGLGHTGRFSQSQNNSTSTSPTGAAIAAALAAAAVGTARTFAINMNPSAKDSPAAEASWSQNAAHAPSSNRRSSTDFPDADSESQRSSTSQLPSKTGNGAGDLRTSGEQLPMDHAAYCLKLQEFQRLVALSGQKRRRPSAGLLSKPSRPLEVKVGLLLHYMLGHMRELYGGQDEADTARKMMHVATMVSGGIELA